MNIQDARNCENSLPKYDSIQTLGDPIHEK